MITAAQLRAARAVVGVSQRNLAETSGLSLPTIRRMETIEGMIRAHVGSRVKLVAALDAAGVDIIGKGVMSQGGGRGVRLKTKQAMQAKSSLATRLCWRKAPRPGG